MDSVHVVTSAARAGLVGVVCGRDEANRARDPKRRNASQMPWMTLARVR
jgi:hypothetical protein